MRNYFVGTIVVLLAAAQAAMSATVPVATPPTPKEFFPDIKGNLTKIVWAHAVNSQAELEKTLTADDIMIIEADVVMGKLNGTGNNTSAIEIPIMAHPPAVESDLSLDEFLTSVLENRKKGFKLDFKTIKAFDMSKDILARHRDNMTVPMFINADILPGPVNATEIPVDANAFLLGATKTLPNSILSVGWTTRFGSEFNITEGRYDVAHIKKMVDTLKQNNVTQSVTYPVRASLAANDIEIIKTLMQNSSSFGHATLTIWSPKDEKVDTDKLSQLIKDVGVEKVYVDVPIEFWKKMNVSGASSSFGATTLMTFGMSLLTLMFAKML